MADYKLTEKGVFQYETGMSIPNATGNRHWQEYLEYVAGGGLTDPQFSEDEIKAINAEKAKTAQKNSIIELENEDLNVKYVLPPSMSEEDKTVRLEHIQAMQADIETPSTDIAYNPPLPPGVTPPVFDSLTVTVTREPGWNDVLGWRAVITAANADFVPGNLAMSIHTGPDCAGYKYTTGAFQYDSINDEYFSLCSPGFEPGDADEFFGVLYGGAALGCFTLLTGEASKAVLVY